ncbi:thiamine pyrophosphate-dependent enzyme [Mesorhizobium marinum]|uniref:thiamine pyrophosphate-dependent enzyme n=1 Tax=Mesorhizobium marinum TaxID=3228790 RepID=UPI003467E90D
MAGLFEGRTVVVTGGTGALGGAVLARLVADGARCRFCRIAEAYGIPAERLSSPADLPAALSRAKAASGPYLVEITVD